MNTATAKKEDFTRHETCVGVFLSIHLAGLTLTLNERKKTQNQKHETELHISCLAYVAPWLGTTVCLWRVAAPLLYDLISKLFQRIYSESAYSFDFSCHFIYLFFRQKYKAPLSPWSSERETTE